MKTIVLPLHSVCLRVADEGRRRDFATADRRAPRGCAARGRSRRGLRRRRARRPATDDNSASPPSDMRGAAQLLDRAEAFEQVARGDDADVADAEAEQEARAVGLALAPRSRRGDCRPTSPSSPRGRAARRDAAQAEDVGGRVQPAELEELGDRLLAQPFDVERAAADEMAQPLEPLRRADQPAGAADVDLALLGDRLAAAFGAMVGEDVRRRAARRASGSRPPAGSRRRRAGCARGRRCAGRAARSRRDCGA